MRLLLVSVLFALSTTAQSQEQEATSPGAEMAALFKENHELLTSVVNDLGRCSALYEILAKMSDADQPATAENWRGMARGARSGALYLLGQEQLWTTGEAKPYGDFNVYVDPVIETSTTYILALAENNDADRLRDEAAKCQALQEIQQSLVQAMRDDFVGR